MCCSTLQLPLLPTLHINLYRQAAVSSGSSRSGGSSGGGCDGSWLTLHSLLLLAVWSGDSAIEGELYLSLSRLLVLLLLLLC